MNNDADNLKYYNNLTLLSNNRSQGSKIREFGRINVLTTY